ncbi:MAG: hypothetical protein JWQ95_6966 [Sphaerisporangium sp.]|jgi:hypothetical protein|nr:hypothetical protein [Sphaerisporangium sp.]
MGKPGKPELLTSGPAAQHRLGNHLSATHSHDNLTQDEPDVITCREIACP